MLKYFIYLVLIFLPCFNAMAFYLSQSIVTESALKHYPKIYASEEKVRLAESKLEEARGEFDTKLNIKQRELVSGYYEDRGYLESKLVKPLSVANANVYTAYSNSRNSDYPEINQYYNTKTEGRLMFGFELSLLRGFLVNERDTLNKLAIMDVDISNYNNKLTMAQVKADAQKSYWKYFYIKQIFGIYQDILQIAIDRQAALEKQVKAGDKPSIILEENQRTILRRKSLAENVKREVLNSAVYLSLYLRDENGDLYDVNLILDGKLDDVDFLDSIKQSHNSPEPTYLQEVVNKRLDVKISEMILKQSNLRIKIAKNNLLPSVDLSFESSKDFGNGDYRKDAASNKIALNVTIPLENKKQSGKYKKAKSEASIVKNDLKLLKDSVLSEIKAIENKINELKQVLQNTKNEIEICKKLVSAEKTRFENGDSDFFMLNAREQDLLYTLDYNIRNKLALTDTLIEYQFATKDTLTQ
jgi:outer membrane protein TolC